MTFTQWALNPDKTGYTPIGDTVGTISPGYYDLSISDGHVFYEAVRTRTDELIRFPHSSSKKVLEGIVDFWDREHLFRKYNLPYKRGILLFGPPGSGKTCTLQLIAREVIGRGGVVVNFGGAGLFTQAYRAFRDVQPQTPMVVLMEDFEGLMGTKSSESAILNILDGVENLDNVVFLATTNYPECLEPRIMDRPSRFDLCVRVGHPGADTRKLYIESLVRDSDVSDSEIACMAEDTEGMSLAHIKELFVATLVLGADYDETVRRLKTMREEKPTSLDDQDVVSKFFGQYL